MSSAYPPPAPVTLPLRESPRGDRRDRATDSTTAAPRPRTGRPFGAREAARRLAHVRALAAAWEALGERSFHDRRHELQLSITRHGLAGGPADACCAYVVEAARRALGLRAYDGQVIAALHLVDNRLVEMATGEGKSLAVALAAAMGGLAGMPVHVLTANDHLVARDTQAFQPLFELLGLGVASVLRGDAPQARSRAYAQAVVYLTPRELAHDHLRDCLSPPTDDRAPRAPGMAIVDEADVLLLDEAQAPLVLQREFAGRASRAFQWQAWSLAGRLEAERDFELRPPKRRAVLTQAGRARINALAAALQPVWNDAQRRDDAIATALTARHLLRRDRDYIVTAGPDKQIAIVDPTTGAIAEGRLWDSGLLALVAMKEGCRLGAAPEPLARVTLRRLLGRYHRLAGISGTLREVRAELARAWGLATVPLAPRLPSLRMHGPARWFATDAARWHAVVQRTRQLTGYGRPVLIGTDSVAESAALVDVMQRAGLNPALLNATFDAAEAATVAAAGERGQITVATLMSGRGVDIAPDASALQAGGLHVIVCQHNASRRFDRQFAGRAGRQGQPGSAEVWLSIESPGFAAAPGAAVLAGLGRARVRDQEVALHPSVLALLRRLQQRVSEARAAAERQALRRAARPR